MKAYLIIKSDHVPWVLTYEPETKTRTLYDMQAWVMNSDAEPVVEKADSWLEWEGVCIECAFPVDPEDKAVRFGAELMLEYTELLDEIELY